MNGSWGILMGCAAALCLMGGCQLCHQTQEIRSDEPMLNISFENDEAKALFSKAVNTTYGEAKTVKRIGVPGFSIYSRDESVAWNANCNDHIRKMDTDGNRVITEQEARSYCDFLATSSDASPEN